MRTGVRPKSPQVTRHVRYARKGQRGGWANHSLEQECCRTSYQLIERLATGGSPSYVSGRELWIWREPPTQAADRVGGKAWNEVSWKLSDFLGLAGHLHVILIITKISLLSFRSLPPSILQFNLPSQSEGRIWTLDSVFQV